MTAVEVCPICDIAGCRHIRERKAMTGEESKMPPLPPRLDPNCQCVCHTQPGVVHIAACCRAPEDDLTKRLGFPWPPFNPPNGAVTIPAWMIELCGEARAEIEALRAKLDSLASHGNAVQETSEGWRDRAERAEAALTEARTKSAPFLDMAREMFARNWNRDSVAIALDNPDEPHRLTFGDFLDLHAALGGEAP